jgi:gas vesicle protein
MPSGGKTKRRKSSRRKKSELDSALGQISDESVAAAKKEFQDLLSQAKGDTTELVRQNAEELEERLVLLKKRRSTRRTLITSWQIKSVT